MKSLARYKNPPVVEVVSGFVLQPVQGLTLPHFGLFWHRIRDQYPESRHAPPLVMEESLPSDQESGFFPPPRIWLISKTQDELIQLQRDRFYFNWREGPNKSKYASYAEIFQRFQESWKLYTTFLTDVGLEQPVIRECELTYINHIPSSTAGASMKEAVNVFVSLASLRGETGFLPSPRSITWTASYELPESKGRLNARIHPALRGNEKEPIFLLELSAKGLGTEATKETIETWFKVAHEWIVKGFEDLTSREFQQRVWGKQ
ncbi:MAG: TIGR04255 family protein [Burkholderiales bacterium]